MDLRLPLLISSCLLILAGCKNKEELVKELPPRSAEKLLDALFDGTPSIEYYSAKGNVTVDFDNEDKRTVNTHIRSVQDSALWVSVTPALGIEVARLLLTSDSLKVLERISDRYFLGTLKEGEKQFGTALDLQLLEQAMKGMAIGLDKEDKYRSDRENGQYVLTSKEPKRFIRLAEDLTPSDTLNESDEEREARKHERTLRQAQNKNSFITKYWIDPNTMLPTRVLLADLALGMQADITYRAREVVGETLLPSELEVLLSDQSHDVRVEMDLSRVKITGPLKLSFRVPDKYEPFEK
jgi:hypothetical protein